MRLLGWAIAIFCTLPPPSTSNCTCRYRGSTWFNQEECELNCYSMCCCCLPHHEDLTYLCQTYHATCPAGLCQFVVTALCVCRCVVLLQLMLELMLQLMLHCMCASLLVCGVLLQLMLPCPPPPSSVSLTPPAFLSQLREFPVLPHLLRVRLAGVKKMRLPAW